MSRAWNVTTVEQNGPLDENARRILAVRIAEFFSWEPIIDDDSSTAALHQLRISGKRLRYTIELFSDVFGEPGQRSVERLKEIQDLLGRLHDIDVRIALIEDELRVLALEEANALNRAIASSDPAALPAIEASSMRPPPDDPRRGLIHLSSRQHAARNALISEFRVRWTSLRDAGFRAELVRLSILPIPSVSEKP